MLLPLVFPTPANGFHYIIHFPFDPLHRGWLLVTALDGRLTVKPQLRHMENQVVFGIQRQLDFKGMLAHCLQHRNRPQPLMVQLL